MPKRVAEGGPVTVPKKPSPPAPPPPSPRAGEGSQLKLAGGYDGHQSSVSTRVMRLGSRIGSR